MSDFEGSASVVRLGSRVLLRDPGMDAEEVGSSPPTGPGGPPPPRGGREEVAIVRSGNDIELFRVSARTPLERALLGRRTGDTVTVHARGANASFVIVAVEG
jgi:hypothetical protein